MQASVSRHGGAVKEPRERLGLDARHLCDDRRLFSQRQGSAGWDVPHRFVAVGQHHRMCEAGEGVDPQFVCTKDLTRQRYETPLGPQADHAHREFPVRCLPPFHQVPQNCHALHGTFVVRPSFSGRLFTRCFDALDHLFPSCDGRQFWVPGMRVSLSSGRHNGARLRVGDRLKRRDRARLQVARRIRPLEQRATGGPSARESIGGLFLSGRQDRVKLIAPHGICE